MPTDTHEELRPLAFSIAYRMVGSVGDAEDLVQEALMRVYDAEEACEQLESAPAYLSAVVTRLSIDHLRSARVRREAYAGPWLPEPLLTDPEPGPEGNMDALAARKPVHGAQRVAKFIAGIVRVGQRQGGYSVRPAWVNHQPGFVITAQDGGVDAVWALDVADGVIQSVRIVRNPEKLGHVA